MNNCYFWSRACGSMCTYGIHGRSIQKRARNDEVTISWYVFDIMVSYLYSVCCFVLPSDIIFLRKRKQHLLQIMMHNTLLYQQTIIILLDLVRSIYAFDPLQLRCITKNPQGYRFAVFRCCSVPDERASNRKIRWSLEAARFGLMPFPVVLNLTDTSVAPLPRCLSIFRAMRSLQYPISWVRDFVRFGGKTSYRLLNRGYDSSKNW